MEQQPKAISFPAPLETAPAPTPLPAETTPAKAETPDSPAAPKAATPPPKESLEEKLQKELLKGLFK
jgi:hypothetical protein